MRSWYANGCAMKAQLPILHTLEGQSTNAPLVSQDPGCDFPSLSPYPSPLQVLTSDDSLNKIPMLQSLLPRDYKTGYHRIRQARVIDGTVLTSLSSSSSYPRKAAHNACNSSSRVTDSSALGFRGARISWQ